MPLFCGDYLADTKHLTLEQHGAYLMLLMVTWRNRGQPLPDDPVRLARTCGVSVSRWTDRLRPALAPFFDLADGTWRQKRLEKEWQFVEHRLTISREHGSLGGRAKALNQKERKIADAKIPLERNATTQPHTHTVEANASTLVGDKGSPARRGTRLPADFCVPDEWLEAGAQAREKAHLPPSDLATEAVKLINHFASKPGTAGTKLDWRKTWINWALNAKGSAANGHDKSRTPASQRFDRGTQALLDAVAERERRRGKAPPGD